MHVTREEQTAGGPSGRWHACSQCPREAAFARPALPARPPGAGPSRAGPSRAGPIHAGPTHVEPTDAGLTHAELTHAEQSRAEALAS